MAPDIALTPAQLIVRALENADRLRHFQPNQREYSSLAQAAIADVLSALAITITGGDKPAIPGLPGGWVLDTFQSQRGNRLWAYVLSAPDRTDHDSKFQYGSPGAAVAAGIDRARKLAGEDG